MTAKGILRLAVLVVIAFALGFWAWREEDATPPHEPGHVTEGRIGVMGTRFDVEVDAADDEIGRAACAAAWDRIEELERAMSTWIEDSNLSRVNREAADHPVEVDPDTFEVLVRAREVWGLSGGAFDPTVGPLIELWRPLSELPAPPTDAEIAAALALVGYEKVALDEDARTVRFAKPGMRLDVGGIAKGYAADQAARAALAAGATAVRINAGGDLTAVGAPRWSPEGFEVEIRDPEGGPEAILAGSEFLLLDRAAATSGNYERFTRIGAERFSHIVDPRTGRPVPNAIAQVTVIADDGTAADAFATALTVLGREAGKRLAESLPGIEALYVCRGEAGRWERDGTSGFPGAGR